MDFNNIIVLAEENKKNPAQVKCFSTSVAPAKKAPRSNVPSTAVQRFLEKREQQEREKEAEAKRQREHLMAIRSSNTKNNKKAKLMASRTKDNNFSRIRLTEHEVESKQKVEASIRRQQLTDKVERMKARIKLEEIEQQLPHKRKRRPKSDQTPSPSTKIRKTETTDDEYDNPPPKRFRKQHPNRGPSSSNQPMSFSEIMRLAQVKQHENAGGDPNQDDWEDFDENDEDQIEDETEQERPMTKKEKAKLMEEQAHFKKKETQEALYSGPPIQNRQQQKRENTQQRPNIQQQGQQQRSTGPPHHHPPPLRNSQPSKSFNGRPEIVPKTSNMKPEKSKLSRNETNLIREDGIPSYSTVQKSCKTLSERNSAAFRTKTKPESNKKVPLAYNGKKPPSDSIRKVPPVYNGRKPPSDSRNSQPVPSYNTTAPKNGVAKQNSTSLNTSQKGQSLSRNVNGLRLNANGQRAPQNGPQKTIKQTPVVRKEGGIPQQQTKNNIRGNVPINQKETRPSLNQLNRSQPLSKGPVQSKSKQGPGLPSRSAPSQNSNGPPGQRPKATSQMVQQQKAQSSMASNRPAQKGAMQKGTMGPPRGANNNLTSRPPMTKSVDTNRFRQPLPPASRTVGSKPPAPFRHEPWPNLARNPYKKLPPITCSRPAVRRIESDDEEEDDEMRDFIDDDPMTDLEDYSKHIKEIFGYDKNRYAAKEYADDEYDDEVMESSFAEQMKEENRSARIALQEDLEEYHRELEEERRMKEKKKKLKK